MADLTITCKCGEEYGFASALRPGDLAKVDHECGATAWVASPKEWEDWDGLRYAFVDEVPDVYVNIHGGDILCLGHAGDSLRSAVEANPRRKNFDTPFGRYVRATEQDVAEFLTSDLEFDCEECKMRRRRAAAN